MKTKKYTEEMGQSHKQCEIEIREYRPIKLARTFNSTAIMNMHITESTAYKVNRRIGIERPIKEEQFIFRMN